MGCLFLDKSGAGAASSQKVVYRKDYKRPEYLIDKVKLDVNLDADVTVIKSLLEIRPASSTSQDLILNGQAIELVSIALNGKPLKTGDYTLCSETETLRIPKKLLSEFDGGKTFQLQIENKNFPSKNLELSGLYVSNKLLCTQMEAEGFRRMTYFIDRPDVMSMYEVRLEADKGKYPVLLCNGDQTKYEELAGNRHAATFVDPFKKPCYLFAIVAGELSYIKDTFTTIAVENSPSHKVDLYVYAAEKYIPQVEWAIECTKRAMKWDEEAYGRQYDLSTFRVVCIEDFNAGAMENKSLTTFNISCVLAHRNHSRDWSFERVLSVIGHEYFHNWSGDRVTVRDWFQITLKEGFTNFREQEFSASQYSAACKRIEDVQAILAAQFPEDAGPMSHPIRPESYVSIDNFYTTTVYDKGSEVIRMMKTIVGPGGFRKGTDLYFSRYDGQAISCDEFRLAIAEANGQDFSQFERWYSQRGTPHLLVTKRHWDQSKSKYIIALKQVVPEKANENGAPLPYHMPVTVGLIGKQSKSDIVPERVLQLRDWEETFEFDNVREDCVPSVLRQFSAPVILDDFLSTEELIFLMGHDTDTFNSWAAGQRVYKRYIFETAEALKGNKVKVGEPFTVPHDIVDAVRQILRNKHNDKEYVALSLSFPPLATMEMEMKPHADPILLHRAAKSFRRGLRAALKTEIESELNKLMVESKAVEWGVSKEDIARRSLQNGLLGFFCAVKEEEQASLGKMVADYYVQATNFNDKSVAFALMVDLKCNERDSIIAQHYDLCKNDPNMLDGWFSAQARQTNSAALENYKKLLQHSDYAGCTNPNRFRSVVTVFATNKSIFHDESGEGYKLFADEVIRFDKFNAYNAAGAAKRLIDYKMYSEDRQKRVLDILKYMNSCDLSKNTREVVERGLNA